MTDLRPYLARTADLRSGKTTPNAYLEETIDRIAKREPVIGAFVVLGLAASAAAKKSYDHPLIEQTFRLLPDGDAVVEEIRAFDFAGEFSWAEVERSTRGQYGRYGLDYEGVWDADTKQPLRYEVRRSGDNVILRWSYQARDETKRFLLRYRIRRAVQRYADVAQLYWDRWGVETVSIRIGSCYPEPKDRRMLATWLSYDDLERAVMAALTAPVVGHSILYGTSDNQTSWYDNRLGKHIGFRPQDSADRFRARQETAQPVLDSHDPAVIHQGGAFVKAAPHG